jgi:hypothetical protein
MNLNTKHLLAENKLTKLKQSSETSSYFDTKIQ